jgi:hypothetical protein
MDVLAIRALLARFRTAASLAAVCRSKASGNEADEHVIRSHPGWGFNPCLQTLSSGHTCARALSSSSLFCRASCC